MTQQNSTSFDHIRHRINYDLLLPELGIDGPLYRGEIWCSCPLPDGNHSRGDRSASFSVNVTDDKKVGLYNCFACGGGTVVDLVEKIRNLDHETALKWLNQFMEGGQALDNEAWLAMIKRNLEAKDQLPESEEMPVYPSDALFQYRFVHPWMLRAGMTEEAVKFFQVGYDHERRSVLLPHWWHGKLVGWQERMLDPEARPRYKSTPKFPKRNTLFNYDNVDSNEVVVVESPKTAVVLWSRGVKNVVATFGASVTQEQVQALWKFDKVYLWFDNDKAGRNGLMTTMQYMRNVCDVWVVPFVEMDKGDAADLPSEETQDYLNRAVPLAVWRMNNGLH